MKLHEKDKQQIIKNVAGRFNMKIAKARMMGDYLEKALLGETDELFYTIKYSMYFQNNTKYSMDVLKCMLETFSFLLSKEEYTSDREELKAFFYLFFEMIFIQRCRYAKMAEERESIVHTILQRVSERLNQTLETQQLMISGISHDMRTSLNAIIGYITLIKEKNILKGEDRTFLDKAENASSVLKNLVTSILDITKIDAGQMEIKEKFFWIDQMILKCIDNLTIRLKNKNVVFKAEVDFFPKKVLGDAQRFIEIIMNLLSNAIKYTDHGFVHLKVRKIQESEESVEIRFEIEDSGMGMTAEELKNMFAPFSRFRTDREGVGLGLHIVHKLAQKLGGNLTAKSKVGEGSTFSFTVTLQKESNEPGKIEKRTICFFTDQKEIYGFDRKIHFLKEHGYKIITFNSPEKFITYLLTQKDKAPDIISIATSHNDYIKFDALINYLKTLEIFDKTTFVAEETGQKVSLEHFDKIYHYFAPISIYFKSPTVLESKKIMEKTDIKKRTNLHILAVDDMETNLEILKMFIAKKYPFTTIDLASGGYEAIGMYKSKTYDIVFIDLKMPGLNGFEVLKKLKTIHGHLPPTYALTADIYKSTYDEVAQAGFSGLLEKPLQLDILFETIERVIDEKNNQ
ncbi:MAG: hypothetical protein P794_05175 [Epsilonproteobacteria bacterium (ex Lamellibrachia satsuma)]|nr:MAG: hypothetical protein P794_05175 [Epsilonproteobacteria bacterium (ex Lamellibrachia satsuma)]